MSLLSHSFCTNSVYLKNLSPLATEAVVRQLLAHTDDQINRVEFKQFPGSMQRYCQVDFATSSGVTATTALNGQNFLGVPLVVSVIDPATQMAQQMGLKQAFPSSSPSPTAQSSDASALLAAAAFGSLDHRMHGLHATMPYDLMPKAKETEQERLERTVQVSDIPSDWDIEILVNRLKDNYSRVEDDTLDVTDRRFYDDKRVALLELKSAPMARRLCDLAQVEKEIRTLRITKAKATVTPVEPDNVSFELPPTVPIPVAYQQLNKLKTLEKVAKARLLAQKMAVGGGIGVTATTQSTTADSRPQGQSTDSTSRRETTSDTGGKRSHHSRSPDRSGRGHGEGKSSTYDRRDKVYQQHPHHQHNTNSNNSNYNNNNNNHHVSSSQQRHQHNPQHHSSSYDLNNNNNLGTEEETDHYRSRHHRDSGHRHHRGSSSDRKGEGGGGSRGRSEEEGRRRSTTASTTQHQRHSKRKSSSSPGESEPRGSDGSRRRSRDGGSGRNYSSYRQNSRDCRAGDDDGDIRRDRSERDRGHRRSRDQEIIEKDGGSQKEEKDCEMRSGSSRRRRSSRDRTSAGSRRGAVYRDSEGDGRRERSSQTKQRSMEGESDYYVEDEDKRRSTRGRSKDDRRGVDEERVSRRRRRSGSSRSSNYETDDFHITKNNDNQSKGRDRREEKRQRSSRSDKIGSERKDEDDEASSQAVPIKEYTSKPNDIKSSSGRRATDGDGGDGYSDGKSVERPTSRRDNSEIDGGAVMNDGVGGGESKGDEYNERRLMELKEAVRKTLKKTNVKERPDSAER